jgi:hypothetical protein
MFLQVWLTVAAAGPVPEECHAAFTSRHLALVLDKCYSRAELDERNEKEKKESKEGSEAVVERTVKGLVPRCLDKAGEAFKALEKTNNKGKKQRLSMLSECRPEGCKSAVDLFLWLVEVILPSSCMLPL